MNQNENLIKSLKEKNIIEFKNLIYQGADITYLNHSCLVLSVSYDNYDLFNYILSLYCVINNDNRVIKVIAKKTNRYFLNKLIDIGIPTSIIKKYANKENKDYLKSYEKNKKIEEKLKLKIKKEKVNKI